MVNCLKNCYDNNITHLDIKLENFLINDDKKLILIDFEHSKKFNSRLQTKSGTKSYCSPELLNYKFYHNSDIWSLGVCWYILLKNEYPYEDITLLNEENIRQIDYSNITQNNIRLFNMMFQIDYKKRCYIYDLIEEIKRQEI